MWFDMLYNQCNKCLMEIEVLNRLLMDYEGYEEVDMVDNKLACLHSKEYLNRIKNDLKRRKKDEEIDM